MDKFQLRNGAGKMNSYSSIQKKGLITPLTYNDDDDPPRTEKQIDRYANLQKVKKALTPNIRQGLINIGGDLSKLTTRMKPGGARNLIYGVSNVLMGKKPNPSDTQLISKRKAAMEIASNKTDYSGYGVLKSQGYGGGGQGMCGKGGCLKP